jgi:aryl-alcohol dehydrogenase-like predicted oxidoreductase
LRELGIGLVCFSPLGRGFLTGAARRAEAYPPSDFRHLDPRLQGANFDANIQAARTVTEIALGRNLTPAQIALAWALHKGDDIVPIPGTKRRTFLEQNLVAAELTLDMREMEQLDSALTHIAGARYNKERMSMVDR